MKNLVVAEMNIQGVKTLPQGPLEAGVNVIFDIPSVEALFGQSPEKALGRRFRFRAIWHPKQYGTYSQMNLVAEAATSPLTDLRSPDADVRRKAMNVLADADRWVAGDLLRPLAGDADLRVSDRAFAALDRMSHDLQVRVPERIRSDLVRKAVDFCQALAPIRRARPSSRR